jgi:hypothetical protein
MVARVAREKNLPVFLDDIYYGFNYEGEEYRRYSGQFCRRAVRRKFLSGGFPERWA